ncbi:MAG: GGDEF domain-containing protein [bacterium]
MTFLPMVKNRFIGLSGLSVLFLFISLLVWTDLDRAIWLFPAYGLLFLWADFWGEKEVQFIFIFLISAIGLLLLSRTPGIYPAPAYAVGMLMEIAGLWAAVLSISATGRKKEKTLHSARLRLQEHGKTAQDLQREMESYNRHRESLAHQTRLQAGLSEAAQSLAGAMNMEEIRSRLAALLSQHFPGSSVRLISGSPCDALENWSMQRNVPLLVQDLANDKRFSGAAKPGGEKSVMVIPLRVLQRTAGFIRLSSMEAGLFQGEDLRTADLLATLAALSMENSYLYSRIQELAIRDGLTGLFTHRAFQQHLQEEVLRSGRSQVPFSMIMCDIDHFKRYNDTFGHQAGDAVLKMVSAVLVKNTREVDFVARYGGEEFAVILPAFKPDMASAAAEQIRRDMENEPFVFEGNRTNVTMSFGVAGYPKDAITASQLVRFADERLYRAKESGRNRVVS